MGAIGLIAEYNPFHNGHAYQLAKLKEHHSDGIIVVMSGSFSQRGEACILSKWQRAEAAILNGADLVLELPIAFSVRSAQDFARGAVSLLNKLNIIDRLAFGTEYPNLELLQSAADYLLSEEYNVQLHKFIQNGYSYGAAAGMSLAQAKGLSEEFYREPNTILAMEYLKAIKYLGVQPKIIPIPIQRIGCSHNSSHTLKMNTCNEADTVHSNNKFNNFASGSDIRHFVEKCTEAKHSLLTNNQSLIQSNTISNIYALQENNELAWLRDSVPAVTYQQFAHVNPAENPFRDKYFNIPNMEKLWLPLQLQILNTTKDNIASIYGVNEGLENAILKHAYSCHSLYTFINSLTTKRYPLTRIKRLVFYLLAKLSQKQINVFDSHGPAYARVLAFNTTGQQLLREIKKCSELTVITKLTKYITADTIFSGNYANTMQSMLALDIKAQNINALCYDEPIFNLDFLTPPIRAY